MGLFSIIIALIALIISSLSLILAYITTRPRIKIKIDDEPHLPQIIIYHNAEIGIALCTFEIKNFSPIGGCIEDCFLTIENKRYHCDRFDSTNTLDKLPDLSIIIHNENMQEIFLDRFRKSAPLLVPGFSLINGIFVFSGLPTNIPNLTTCTITFVKNARFRRYTNFVRRAVSVNGEYATNKVD